MKLCLVSSSQTFALQCESFLPVHVSFRWSRQQRSMFCISIDHNCCTRAEFENERFLETLSKTGPNTTESFSFRNTPDDNYTKINLDLCHDSCEVTVCSQVVRQVSDGDISLLAKRFHVECPRSAVKAPHHPSCGTPPYVNQTECSRAFTTDGLV